MVSHRNRRRPQEATIPCRLFGEQRPIAIRRIERIRMQAKIDPATGEQFGHACACVLGQRVEKIRDRQIAECGELHRIM